MPSVSRSQQRLMAMAAHHPEKVSAKNRGILKMGTSKLREFASTKLKGLPEKA